MGRRITLLICVSFFLFCGFSDRGRIIDSLDGVSVFYNGRMFKTSGRHLAPDGYNLGLKWQCVEFVKRYYYEVHGHKFPNSYGNAKDFFQASAGGKIFNTKRGLYQYPNDGRHNTKKGDLIVFGASSGNPYGHVCIVSEVLENNKVEIIQQNWGYRTRDTFYINNFGVLESEVNPRLMGWLRTD